MPEHTFFPFGALLKAFRTRRRLTQQQLASSIGVHRSAIIRWEVGTFLPENKTIVLELARYLRLDDQETRQLLEASLTALAPHWQVPFQRNPYFTGREEVLKALHTHLVGSQMVTLTQSYALHGLGGIGKTQLALEYSYRHALEYSAVFWIEAETEETVISCLLRLAEVLQLPERQETDQQRVVAAVQRWLSSHSGWLLIWDNLEDLTLLDRLLPPTRQGALLLTTRAHALGTLAQGIDLVPLEPEEGLLFLLRRAKLLSLTATSQDLRQLAVQNPAQYQAAASVVSEMGGLPLALDQAGAYLEATRCSLPAYLELFRTQRGALLQQRGDGAREHTASVSSTFTLALASTTRRHPAVGDLLRVCALLHAEAIPEELVRQGAPHWGAPLEAVCRDPLEWNRVLGAACSYSLVSRHPEGQTLSIHRLVQAMLLETMTEAERALWMRRVSEALEVVFPEVLQETAYAAWKQGERLLPHALLCLSRTDAAGESLALASLAYKTAQYLRARGQFGQAEPLFHRALRIREHVLGVDHPLVVSLLNGLASISWERGDYAQAEPLFHRALRLVVQLFGDDHPEVAHTLNNLANLSWSQGRYAPAEALYQRALAIRESALGPEDSLVAESLDNLAMIYAEQGAYAPAEPLLQRALAMRERALGPEHPRVAFTLNNLAEVYHKQGKYPEAERLHQRALALRERALGPDHPLLATSLHNLAELAAEQGQALQAERFYQRALLLWEQALGPDHPYVAVALSGLAALSTAPAAQAQALYQRALQINEQRLGPEHPSVAIQLHGLANLLRDQGDDAQAEARYQRALAIQRLHLGALHPETAHTLHDLALFHQTQGRLSEARSLAERALSIRAQALGEAHPKTIATRALYAQLLQEPSLQEEEPGADRPIELRPRPPRATKQTAGSVRSGALPPAPGDPAEPSRSGLATASLPGSSLPGAAEDASESQTGSGTHSPLPDRSPLHVMRVAVWGVNALFPYTRTVSMREVTFTCTICGRTVTEWHYPSGRIKYCSDACRAVSAAQRHEARVAKQREKRRIARGAQPQA